MKNGTVMNSINISEMHALVQELQSASKDLVEIEGMRIEAQSRLDKARTRLHTITGANGKDVQFFNNDTKATVATPSFRKGVNNHRGTRPGELRNGTLKVLASGPLTCDEVVERVLKIVPTSTEGSAAECLYSLRRRKYVKLVNGKYMLA